MNKVKLKFLILYSVVCTMALIRTCTNDDMFVGFALREISGLELPTADCLRIDRLISEKINKEHVSIDYVFSVENKKILQERLEKVMKERKISDAEESKRILKKLMKRRARGEQEGPELYNCFGNWIEYEDQYSLGGSSCVYFDLLEITVNKRDTSLNIVYWK